MLIISIICVCMLISGSVFHFSQYVCEIICTYMELECKSRKSRDTRSNLEPSLVLETKWSRAKAIEFCQENALVIANTFFQQQKRRLHIDITRWSTSKSDWLYSLQPNMEKLYTVNKKKTGSWQRLRSWTPYCQIQA